MDIEIAVEGGTVAARRRPGTGVPVVMVHGSGGGLNSWNPVIGYLPDDIDTWAYARRGYAPSSASTQPKTFQDEVEDLAAVITAAGGHAHVLGGSLGAAVSLHHALAHPDTVASLALFEPPLFAAGAALLPVLDAYRTLVDNGRLTEASYLFSSAVARMPEELLGPRPAPEAPVPDAPTAVAGAVAILHDLEAMAADGDDMSRWAALNRPVLLMQGAETWSPMPETIDALAAVLPHAARVSFAGQSHFATFTAPELVARALLDLIEST